MHHQLDNDNTGVPLSILHKARKRMPTSVAFGVVSCCNHVVSAEGCLTLKTNTPRLVRGIEFWEVGIDARAFRCHSTT